MMPSSVESQHPSPAPSVDPSPAPSTTPTTKPSVRPSTKPSVRPSTKPSLRPSRTPSQTPSGLPSRVPSAMPTMDLLDELKPFIAPTKADLAKFNKASTPQAKAMEWLRADPIVRTPGRTTRTALERYVLAVFYFSTTPWPTNLAVPFLSNVTVCQWYRISCGPSGYVDEFKVMNIGLGGIIPWEMGLLSDLSTFWVLGNQLTGTIPTTLNQLTKLTSLDVDHNSLSGPLPANLPRTLLEIDLSNNAFTGVIPSTWRGTNLPSVTRIDISHNSVGGFVPSTLGSISTVTNLLLHNTSIRGSVNTTLCPAGRTWTFLSADCWNSNPVTCSCCTKCY